VLFILECHYLSFGVFSLGLVLKGGPS